MDWHRRFTQQAGWTQALRRYLFERVGVSPGQRLLEVGCGTGAVLSTFSGAGSLIHGLDLNREFLQQAQQNVPTTSQNSVYTQSATELPEQPSLTHSEPALVQGDAHHLPYAEGSFDLVFCHYLLLWVRNPAEVISEMRRVTRPGGWVLALAEPDYGGRVDYPEALIPLGVLQEAALSRQGAQTRLGRRLAALFHDAGLAEIETGVLGGQWREAPSPQEQAQEWAVLKADLAGDLPTLELARLRQLDQQAWARGERVLFVPTFYAMGRLSGS